MRYANGEKKIKDKPQYEENTSQVYDNDIEKKSPGFYIKEVVPYLTIYWKMLLYFFFRRGYFKEVKNNFKYYKRKISALLPEAIKQKSSSESTMDFVLERFSGENDKKTKVIVDLLSLAIKIVN